MSFFYDFIESINVLNINNEMVVSIVLGQKIIIVANFKIVNVDKNIIEFKYKNLIYKILGNNLKIESLSKGELVVIGNIFGFVRGDNG